MMKRTISHLSLSGRVGILFSGRTTCCRWNQCRVAGIHQIVSSKFCLCFSKSKLTTSIRPIALYRVQTAVQIFFLLLKGLHLPNMFECSFLQLSHANGAWRNLQEVISLLSKMKCDTISETGAGLFIKRNKNILTVTCFHRLTKGNVI